MHKARIGLRFKSSFRLKPDPTRIPKERTLEERFKDAQPKTGTIEDFQLYERQVAPNNIRSVLKNGFKLESGSKIVSDLDKNPTGLLLLGHEAFTLDLSSNVSKLKGSRIELIDFMSALEIVHPKPELMVIGLGSRSRVLGPETMQFFRKLGIQTDISTTRNAASNYDLLANERGKSVGALMLPPDL